MSRSFSANFGSFDSLKVRMRCGASWWASRMRCTERRLTPAALASIRPVQWVASPGGADERQVDHPLHRGRRQRRLAGLARLVAQQPVDALRHEALLPAPDHRLGLAGSPHDLGGAAAVGGGQDDFGAPDMLLRRVAIGDDRLKPTAIFRRDVDDNPCSHAESLNCFGRFGNRPNESDH